MKKEGTEWGGKFGTIAGQKTVTEEATVWRTLNELRETTATTNQTKKYRPSEHPLTWLEDGWKYKL